MIPLLALHGFTGSPKSWDFLPNPETLPRTTPVLVGHAGSTAGSEVQTFEDEVERLAALATEYGSVHLVGYSLGARLALGIALRYPERVARLTLVSGHPGLATEAERAQRRAADEHWCELLLTRGLTEFVAVWQDQPLWATQSQLDAARLAQKRGERLSHEAVGLVHSLRCTGLGQMPNYADHLQKLRVPVAVLAGELDTKFSALGRAITERVAHAKLEIVPGAGHDLLLERPEFVTEVIRRGNQT